MLEFVFGCPCNVKELSSSVLAARVYLFLCVCARARARACVCSIISCCATKHQRSNNVLAPGGLGNQRSHWTAWWIVVCLCLEYEAALNIYCNSAQYKYTETLGSTNYNYVQIIRILDVTTTYSRNVILNRTDFVLNTISTLRIMRFWQSLPF
jgi:hypothetical protein